MTSQADMREVSQHRLAMGRMARWRRGLASAMRIYGVPLGNWWCGSIDHLSNDERRAEGLVLVLPGIEGRSTLNLDIARGLVDGGVSCAVEVHDWTTGRMFFSFYHLRSTTWHALAAARLAARIVDYQDEFPGRPVVLVGHSGGAALSLEALPLLGDRQIGGAILLASAVSPEYDPTAARHRTRHGIWSLHSPWDWLQLGLGTLAVGTFDGKHAISSGMVGFRGVDRGVRGVDRGVATEEVASPAAGIPPFHQRRYRFAMLRSWNFGGHHGCANRLFSAEWLAPMVRNMLADKP